MGDMLKIAYEKVALEQELAKTKQALDIAIAALEDMQASGKVYMASVALNKIKECQK